MALNVLVTGSAGFIGKHVADALAKEGCHIWPADCYEPRVHRSVDLNVSPEATRCADIPGWKLAEADVIVHLAAQVGVADSMHVPLRYVHDNTLDTARFLENVLALKDWASWRLKRLVVASSMSVYGDPGTAEPIAEDWPVRPASVYGLTKYDQEQLALLFGQRAGVDVVALRLWNVYGPGQALHNPYTGVLANFANAFLNGIQPTIYEDGLQTRDFIHVSDVAAAFVEAALGSGPLGIFNIATGLSTTILAAAARLGSALGSTIVPNVPYPQTSRLGDIRHAIGNSHAFQRAYKWLPQVTFAQGIESYAQWLISEHGTPAPKTAPSTPAASISTG